MMVLLKSSTERSFELVIDLTQASQQNEPDVRFFTTLFTTFHSFNLQLELLIKFAAYIPEIMMNQIEAIYFYNPNVAFKVYATKLSSSIRIFSHIKVRKIVTMIVLSEYNIYYYQLYLLLRFFQGG